MKSFVLQQAQNGLWYGTFPALSQIGIRHGISARLGGVSEAPFSSLNLGLHTGDHADRVVANRQRFAEAVGIDFGKVVTAEQVHGDQVAAVEYSHAGRGAAVYQDALPAADALITNCQELPLMLFFADCVPVIIADPIRGVVGISHAGWKGTVARIAAKTVTKMTEQFQTSPADCIAAIGPSIGPCCYEVDAPVVEILKDNFASWESLVVPSKEKQRWQLDLWEANRVQLLEVGVKSDNIHMSQVCTACNASLFFSHRADQGKTGRLGAVIMRL